MSPAREIITTIIAWESITIEVVYERNWLNLGNPEHEIAQAHFDIRSVNPERAPLPITETGYRSHFVHPSEVDELGGPSAYVVAWLGEASRQPEWRAIEQRNRQLSLFD